MKRRVLIFGFVPLLVLLLLLLIPMVPGPANSEVAATRAQYSGYVNALSLFKNEYGYFPTMFEGREQTNISTYPESEQFIEVLSGRTLDGERSTEYGNTRGIYFYDFSASELVKHKELGYTQVVDRTGNTNIVICIDHNGDGAIKVPGQKGLEPIRATVTIYSIPDKNGKAVKLWE